MIPPGLHLAAADSDFNQAQLTRDCQVMHPGQSDAAPYEKRRFLQECHGASWWILQCHPNELARIYFARLTIEGRREEDECVIQVLAVLLERQAGVVGQLEVQIIATLCEKRRKQFCNESGMRTQGDL